MEFRPEGKNNNRKEKRGAPRLAWKEPALGWGKRRRAEEKRDLLQKGERKKEGLFSFAEQEGKGFLEGEDTFLHSRRKKDHSSEAEEIEIASSSKRKGSILPSERGVRRKFFIRGERDFTTYYSKKKEYLFGEKNKKTEGDEKGGKEERKENIFATWRKGVKKRLPFSPSERWRRPPCQDESRSSFLYEGVEGFLLFCERKVDLGGDR